MTVADNAESEMRQKMDRLESPEQEAPQTKKSALPDPGPLVIVQDPPEIALVHREAREMENPPEERTHQPEHALRVLIEQVPVNQDPLDHSHQETEKKNHMAIVPEREILVLATREENSTHQKERRKNQGSEKATKTWMLISARAVVTCREPREKVWFD